MSSSSREPRPTKNRWFFSKEQILDTPSKRDGIERYDELRYRQNAANLIQVNSTNINFTFPDFTIYKRVTNVHYNKHLLLSDTRVYIWFV